MRRLHAGCTSAARRLSINSQATKGLTMRTSKIFATKAEAKAFMLGFRVGSLMDTCGCHIDLTEPRKVVLDYDEEDDATYQEIVQTYGKRK
jgi:hypothetical protein